METTLQEQIDIFKKKVAACQKVYVPRVLDRMVQALSSRPVADSIDSINTIRILKELVKLEAERVDTTVRDAGYHENNLLVFFKWYLNFLDYMDAIRSKYESSIWNILQRHFNPYKRPVITNERSILGSSSSENNSLMSTEGCSDKNKLRLKALTLLGTDYSSLKKAYDTTDVEITMGTLDIIMTQWNELLNPDTVLTTTYIRDLYQNIDPTHHVKNGSSGSNIVHVVPLVLALCEKAAIFAAEWLEQHKRKRDMLKIHLHEVKKADGELKSELEVINGKLSAQVDELQQEEDSLKSLLNREERSATLDTELYQLQTEIEDLENQLQNNEKQEKYLLKTILSKKDISHDEILDLREQYQDNHTKGVALNHVLQSKKYQSELINSDLEVEKMVKPSIIRFTNDVQEKCEQLESDIGAVREKKYTLEQALGTPTAHAHNPPLPVDSSRQNSKTGMSANFELRSSDEKMTEALFRQKSDKIRRMSIPHEASRKSSISGPPMPPQMRGTSVYVRTTKKKIEY